MNRRVILIIGIVLVVVAIVAGAWWIGSGSGAPSVPITSATLEPQDAGNTGVLFRINPELSEVRFIITEELFGSPKTVVGVTDQVAGDIIIDFDNPTSSEIGEIRVNARTLETDDENRNRAIRNLILESRSDEFEFASFMPTALDGLPEESVEMGEAISFQVVGDLTVRHITQPVTFDVSATLVSEARLEGSATTMVTRGAYELTIPNAPGVANVSDEVQLEIDFVAIPVEEE